MKEFIFSSIAGCFIFAVAVCGFFAAPAFALEIPVSGVSDGKAVRIAYADMELIYNVCPQKARASKEYLAAKDVYEIRISSLTAALDIRRGEFERLKSEAEDRRRASGISETEISTAAAPSPEVSVAVESAYEKELLRKGAEADIARLQASLAAVRAEMEYDLRALEKECSMRILEDIYKVLEQIAVEEELLVIIDKNYILYSRDAYDITPKAIERLK